MNFGTAQLPTGKQRANSICWAGFGLYSKSENKDAAWAFLRWIGADKGAEICQLRFDRCEADC